MATLMNGTDYYIPALALGTAFVAKLPGLIRGWRDPMVLAVSSLILAASGSFFFAAPPTIRVVNRWTGIDNLCAPLDYAAVLIFSCSSIVLIINWRGGPAEEIHRSMCRWVTGYAAVLALMIVLFALGDVPVERLQDFDTYYAKTPFIREMIALYLVGHMVAAAIICTMCWRWAREVQGWLRGGLGILVAGFTLNLIFGFVKMAGVVGRWFGTENLDILSTSLAPTIAAGGAFLSAIGFLLPLVAGKAADWRTYWRLRSLANALAAADPIKGGNLKLPFLAGLEQRLTRRETLIRDSFLALGPWLAPLDAQRSDNLSAVEAARMIAAAMEARSASPGLKGDDSVDVSLTRADVHYLTQVSRAFARH